MAQKVGDTPLNEAWANDVYDCQVRYLEFDRTGALHLSVKRLDREPVWDWRHLQSIKNEVAGPFREAIELFPDERRLVDGSNQYHLWVMPEDVRVPLGFNERIVSTHEQMVTELRRYGVAPGKARQRPWQPGLSTGPNYKP